jgi:hypothetical protein
MILIYSTLFCVRGRGIRQVALRDAVKLILLHFVPYQHL